MVKNLPANAGDTGLTPVLDDLTCPRPQCKLVVVHAFRELGGVRLQASKHGLPPTPVGGPVPLPSSLPAQHPWDGAEINAPSEGVGALPAPQQPQPSVPSKTPTSGRLFRLNLGPAP